MHDTAQQAGTPGLLRHPLTGLKKTRRGYALPVEFWPGSLVLTFEGTLNPLNMQSEVPLLEHWLLDSAQPVTQLLADRLADAQDRHSRSTQPEIELAIGPAEAQAILEVLEVHRDVVGDHDGLVNLGKALRAA